MRARPLIQHVGVEAFGPEQRHVALEPALDLLQPREFAGKHVLAALEIGTRLQAMVAGLEVIAEIAGSAQASSGKMKAVNRICPVSPIRHGRA